MVVHRGSGATIASSEFRVTSADGLRIACARWDSRGPVRGVVQIAHGMGEHIGRYVELIDALISAGLTVYGDDHRGHGRTASSATHFGDFGEGGFDLLVEDMVRLSRIAKEENPDRPFILMGHSMGSFAAQQYVLDHSGKIDGLILSGSGALDRLAQLARSAPAGTNILNAPFEPARTPFDCTTAGRWRVVRGAARRRQHAARPRDLRRAGACAHLATGIVRAGVVCGEPSTIRMPMSICRRRNASLLGPSSAAM
jgi:alpha-beta hydrolase superfamily lysophospholipase